MTTEELLAEETYPYSMGTTPAINKIESIIGLDNNQYDTLLINIESLIRNNYTTNMSATDLFKAVESELDDVLYAITDIMSKCPNIRNPFIVIYCHDMSKKLPVELCKKVTTKRVTMNVVNKMFWRQFRLQKQSILINNTNTLRVAFDNNTWPHFSIRETLRKLKNTQTVILLSHVVLDFHVMKWFKSMILLESFTGNLITTKDLPKKVFKNEVIPFTESTHAILGDKDLIKCSLKPKRKKEFVQLATNENWIVHSTSYVTKSILKNNFKIYMDLSKRRG